MSDNKKTEVFIDGRRFTIIGNESSEYIRNIASYVDCKIKDITLKNKKLSKSMVATLAAINITDELYRIKYDFNILKDKSKDPIEKYSEMNTELEDSKKVIEKLKKELKENIQMINEFRVENEDLIRTLEDIKLSLSFKEEEIENNEKTIKKLQDKIFDTQIELIDVKKELDESLKTFDMVKEDI